MRIMCDTNVLVRCVLSPREAAAELLRRVIAELAYNPRPPSAKPMEDELSGYLRIRVDDYRIIYTIEDDVLLIEIVRVAPRTPSTYKGLK